MFIQKKWRAHLTEDGREQTILEHLYGTAELASGFANSFGYSEQGKLVEMAHDIGTATMFSRLKKHQFPSFKKPTKE